MAFAYIEKRLSRLLARHGRYLASHPLPFIVIPIILSVVLAFGTLTLEQNTDTEYLFSPENGPAKTHRREIEKRFPVNYDGGFLPDRKTEVGRYAHALITARDGDSVLTEDILDEIITFHGKVVNLTVTLEGISDYTYDDLCGKWKTECVDPNLVLKLLDYSARNINFLTLSYPVTVFQNVDYFIGSGLGGVKLENQTDTIKTAKAMSLLYSLRSDELDSISRRWEELFVKLASKPSNKIVIDYIISSTFDHDFVDIVYSTMDLLVISFFILTSFAVMSCMMLDWVASKPVLAILGVVSALLAVVSSFGLLLFCGVPFTHLVIGMPFLTLGVGVDDMFIMIASWRTTSPHLSVRDRLGKTFSEAALSITITSITDALAFGIGAISNFPSVRIFCCYCGVAIVFDYIYQLTFFGGCMALIGRREEQNKHCLTFREVLPKSEAPSGLYRLFCSGGISKKRQNGGHERSEHIVMKFFKEWYGPLVTRPWFKILTAFIYLGYLGLAVFGCLQLSEGIIPQQLALESSYSVQYYDTQQKYFQNFGPVVQVVITSPQNYSVTTVQKEISNVIENYQGNMYYYTEGYATRCWLTDYVRFLNQTGLSAENEDTFVYHLQHDFLPRYEFYKLDVVFSADDKDIVSSRFLVFSRNRASESATLKREFMHESRDIASASWIPMLAYHPSFIFDDHFDAILPSTIQNVLIAAVGMLLVSLLLIPQPICGVYVTVSITSIVVGVLGYMALWDVGLDFVSMIIIVVCIGFSVDYSAHVTYAFVISPRDSRNERAVESLHLLGLPILQSVTSTVIAIALISTSETYAFRAIFKTMFLGITFGGLHGLLFLPVLLSFLGPSKSVRKQDKGTRPQEKDIHEMMDIANANRSPEEMLASFRVVLNPKYRESETDYEYVLEGELWQPIARRLREKSERRTGSKLASISDNLSASRDFEEIVEDTGQNRLNQTHAPTLDESNYVITCMTTSV